MNLTNHRIAIRNHVVRPLYYKEILTHHSSLSWCNDMKADVEYARMESNVTKYYILIFSMIYVVSISITNTLSHRNPNPNFKLADVDQVDLEVLFLVKIFTLADFQKHKLIDTKFQWPHSYFILINKI